MLTVRVMSGLNGVGSASAPDFGLISGSGRLARVEPLTDLPAEACRAHDQASPIPVALHRIRREPLAKTKITSIRVANDL